MLWWRVIVTHGDYEYGAVACFEKEEEAEQAKNALMANRTDNIRMYGIEFVVRNDGDEIPQPLNLHGTLQWAERLIPPTHRSLRRGSR